jgi:hypothetical protein
MKLPKVLCLPHSTPFQLPLETTLGTTLHCPMHLIKQSQTCLFISSLHAEVQAPDSATCWLCDYGQVT